MEKAGGGIKSYFSGLLQSLLVNFVWFVILIVGKNIGKRIKLRNLHLLNNKQVYKPSWTGYLVKHQAYGDIFCYWLFYKTGNCREAVISQFSKRGTVSFSCIRMGISQVSHWYS